MYRKSGYSSVPWIARVIENPFSGGRTRRAVSRVYLFPSGIFLSRPHFRLIRPRASFDRNVAVREKLGDGCVKWRAVRAMMRAGRDARWCVIDQRSNRQRLDRRTAVERLENRFYTLSPAARV